MIEKFCKDCRWFQADPEPGELYASTCCHPEVMVTSEVYVLNGVGHPRQAIWARGFWDNKDYPCGLEAKLWQDKP